MGQKQTDSRDTLWTGITEDIYRTYHPQIYNYLRHKFPREAEDMTSEVFMRALVADRNGHGPHTTTRGWLFRIARSVISDYARRTARKPEPYSLTDAHQLPTEETGFNRTHLQLELDQALPHLLPRHVELCALKADGWDNKQIAGMLNLTHGATRQLLARARDSLRRHLPSAPTINPRRA